MFPLNYLFLVTNHYFFCLSLAFLFLFVYLFIDLFSILLKKQRSYSKITMSNSIERGRKFIYTRHTVEYSRQLWYEEVTITTVWSLWQLSGRYDNCLDAMTTVWTPWQLSGSHGNCSDGMKTSLYWQPCSVSCGHGTGVQQRTRSCNTTEGECQGSDKDTQNCTAFTPCAASVCFQQYTTLSESYIWGGALAMSGTVTGIN